MCDKWDGLATTMEHSGKNHINPTILLHLALDSYSFFIMFLLEIETDHLLESYSNIAIGRIQLDQLDSANLSKSRFFMVIAQVQKIQGRCWCWY